MSKMLGHAMLLKIKNGASYATVGGIKTKKWSLNNSTIDVTSSDSYNAGILQSEIEMGLQKFTVDGTILFDADAQAVLLMEAARLQTSLDVEVFIPNWKTLQCSTLFVTKLEGAGDDGKEAQFTISLEASGTINAS